MTDTPFSPEVIERLSREMDVRLAELATSGDPLETRGPSRGKGSAPLPLAEKEAAIVEKALAEAGQEPMSFWQRFQKAAHEDICEKGGVLYGQWKKWGDLSNKTVLRQFGVILAAMGYSGGPLQVLALSCAVVVVHLGVKAYCMEAEAAAKATEGKK